MTPVRIWTTAAGMTYRAAASNSFQWTPPKGPSNVWTKRVGKLSDEEGPAPSRRTGDDP